MNEHVRDLFAKANSGTDSSVGVSDSLVGRWAALRNLFKAIWPKKTAVHLALVCDTTVRQAERIIGDEQGIGAAALVRLLRSEHGGDVLETLMEGANPAWWQASFKERQIAAARRARKEAERRLKALEDDA
jgi:hypothetical protein